MSALVLGVDPGVRGGMAILDEDRIVHDTYRFDPGMTEKDFIDTMIEVVAAFDASGRVCFMEKVGYIRGDGGQGAFTFGKIYGLLRGSLLTFGFKIHDVYPAIWQSRLECLTGGNKNVSKSKAQRMFPGEKVTHAIADALLIAEYGRLQMQGL